MRNSISISDKAKAVVALNAEITSLQQKATEMSAVSIEYRDKIVELSKQHVDILNRIIALEDAIAKIIR